MICLTRGKSNRLNVCEAVLRRGVLSVEEEARIREQMWRVARGMDGEQRADRFWEEVDLEGLYRLFHNFETVNRTGYTHQMDTVFLCPRFILVLELKHIAGELMYEASRHQLLRTYQGQTMALGDPFSQVTRHEEWLEHFLWDIGVRNLPIISAVVVTTVSSVLKEMPKRFHVFKLEGLRLKLKEWYEQYPIVLNARTLTHIQEELLRRRVSLKWKLPIDQLQLRRGVLCDCDQRMVYKNGVFTCVCGARSRDGFERGLLDYRLLVDEWITNGQFREFFELENVQMASKILKRLNLKYEGARKNRRYLIPEDILQARLYKRGRVGG